MSSSMLLEACRCEGADLMLLKPSLLHTETGALRACCWSPECRSRPFPRGVPQVCLSTFCSLWAFCLPW